jgi:hypothetical protein
MEALAQEWIIDSPDLREDINKSLILATIMTTKYEAHIIDNRMDRDLEFEETEAHISVQMDKESNVTLTMKLDVLGRRKSTGMPVIIDHKTVDQIGQGEGHGKLDLQFRTYDLGMFLKTGIQHDGVIINELRRVDSSMDESKPPYFNRWEVRWNMEEMRNHWTHLMITANRIRKARAQLDNGVSHHQVVVPKPSMMECRRCNYRVPCGMADDGSDMEGYIQEIYTVQERV